MKQLEKAVSGKEPRYVLRALRALPSTSRRLNSNVLHKAINGFFTSNSTVRDFLLSFLEEVRQQGMGIGGQLRRARFSHNEEPLCGAGGHWERQGLGDVWDVLTRLLRSACEMRCIAAALGRDGMVVLAAWAGSCVTPQAELSPGSGWGQASLQAEA